MVYVTHDQTEAMTMADRVVVMNHGVIEQIGPPQELYHRPLSRFVAGFIGSPAMNFLPARVVAQDGGLAMRLEDGATLAVPPERASAYAPFRDKDVILGLRPEGLTEPRGKRDAAPFDARIDIVEPLGMETIVHFALGGTTVCARVDPATQPKPGTTMPLTADMSQMHLINPESGLVVLA